MVSSSEFRMRADVLGVTRVVPVAQCGWEVVSQGQGGDDFASSVDSGDSGER
jgi:hypothetical protein